MGVLTATELYMLTDKSPGFSNTYAFLDRALQDCEKGEEIIENISNTLFGLWTAKNAFIEMTKPTVIDPETREAKADIDRRL